VDGHAVRQASKAIRAWRPWEQSTGPRTTEGKSRSARNADRGRQWRREREMIQADHVGLRSQGNALGALLRAATDLESGDSRKL
jgi:hypothetical protein